jgi:hypothetical protein
MHLHVNIQKMYKILGYNVHWDSPAVTKGLPYFSTLDS